MCFVESLVEARRAFDTIIGKVNLFGEVNAKVLVQEFLQGTEYVVDCVSKDGVHKVRQKPFTTEALAGERGGEYGVFHGKGTFPLHAGVGVLCCSAEHRLSLAVSPVCVCPGGGHLAVRQEALQRQPLRLLRGTPVPSHCILRLRDAVQF